MSLVGLILQSVLWMGMPTTWCHDWVWQYHFIHKDKIVYTIPSQFLLPYSLCMETPSSKLWSYV